MTLALIKPAGWDPEDPLTSDEMNAFQAELVKAIDGDGGGAYEIQNDLVLNGPGQLLVNTTLDITDTLLIEPGATLQVSGNAVLSNTATISGTATVSGHLNIASGGEVNVQNGAFLRIKGPTGGLDVEAGAAMGVSGTMTVFGDVDLSTGGEMNVQTGCKIDVEANGRINLLAGSPGGKIVGSAGSEIQVFDAEDLTINNSSGAFRLTLTPLQINEVGGVPSFKPFSGSSGCWLMHDATANGSICFALPINPGDVITTLRMTLQGQSGVTPHGGNVGSRPKMQLCTLSAAGIITVVSQVTDPVAAQASYDASHAVTLSSGSFDSGFAGTMPYTVTTALTFVRVTTEGGTNAAADLTMLTAIDGTLTAKSFRPANQFF